MDNLYYKLCKKCENLEQKIKLKLQLVDKTKMFALLEEIENPTLTPPKRNKRKQGSGIASNLYDEDEPSEIHISEGDDDSRAEDEVVIDEE